MSQAEIMRRERVEHNEAIDDIRAMLTTLSGKRFLKYLFKSFNVGEMPTMGLEGMLLGEALGWNRAGESIFKLVAEANYQMAGLLLAEKEKENYAITLLENGFPDPNGREE